MPTAAAALECAEAWRRREGPGPAVGPASPTPIVFVGSSSTLGRGSGARAPRLIACCGAAPPLPDRFSTAAACLLAPLLTPRPPRPLSPLPGKRHNKTHTLCRRCGRHSFHIQKSTCAGCGYPAARLRKCESFFFLFFPTTARKRRGCVGRDGRGGCCMRARAGPGAVWRNARMPGLRTRPPRARHATNRPRPLFPSLSTRASPFSSHSSPPPTHHRQLVREVPAPQDDRHRPHAVHEGPAPPGQERVPGGERGGQGGRADGVSERVCVCVRGGLSLFQCKKETYRGNFVEGGSKWACGCVCLCRPRRPRACLAGRRPEETERKERTRRLRNSFPIRAGGAHPSLPARPQPRW